MQGNSGFQRYENFVQGSQHGESFVQAGEGGRGGVRGGRGRRSPPISCFDAKMTFFARIRPFLSFFGKILGFASPIILPSSTSGGSNHLFQEYSDIFLLITKYR